MRLRTIDDRVCRLHAGVLALGQGTHERQVIEAQPEASGHDLVLRSRGEEAMTFWDYLDKHWFMVWIFGLLIILPLTNGVERWLMRSGRT
jgi:hypothetical protein